MEYIIFLKTLTYMYHFKFIKDIAKLCIMCYAYTHFIHKNVDPILIKDICFMEYNT